MSFKVVGIGEVLWDLLPSGPQVGGAPGNFAFHAYSLGADAAVITRVGGDNLGFEIKNRFERLGIADGTMQTDEEAPTGTVSVSLSGSGIPNFTIHEDVAWDRLAITPQALAAVEAADAVCFGSLAQRNEPSRTSIQKLVAASSSKSLRVFDINLRQNFYSTDVIRASLELANVFKLNDSELEVLARMFRLTGSVREQVEQLAREFDLHVIALTRGPSGSLLFQAGEWADQTSAPTAVVDTVGAGDAFTAALVMGLLLKRKIAEISQLADEVARYVCSCPGATPALPKAICERFANNLHPHPIPAKLTGGIRASM